MKLGDRDYFIWETSLLFSSDMINKRVKHIPSEVSPAISASAFGRCFWWIEEVEHGFSAVALTISALITARL